MLNQSTDIAALAVVLREHMVTQGFSLSELARKADVSKSTLSKILSGRTSPYVHTLYQICDALGISLAEVLSEQESVQRDAQQHGITDEELGMIITIRSLSAQKRQWLDTSVAMLAAYESDVS